MRIQIRLYFTKANLLINYHRVFFPSSPFFAAERDKFTQQTHKNEYLHSNYTYFTINSFQKHQYVSVCSENTSNFLRFSQVLFSRFHAKNQTPMVFNQTHIVCPLILSIPFTHSSEPKEPYRAFTRSLSVDCKFVAS